jgi:hypothetical protein
MGFGAPLVPGARGARPSRPPLGPALTGGAFVSVCWQRWISKLR